MSFIRHIYVKGGTEYVNIHIEIRTNIFLINARTTQSSANRNLNVFLVKPYFIGGIS